MTTVLYHYYRSSCSWRVRWALALKDIAYEAVAIDLMRGEQRDPDFRAKNPFGTVPLLCIDGLELAESLAIIEYLDETRGGPKLLPETPRDRARVRQLALVIAADTQPLQNTSVLVRVEKFATDPDGRRRWAADVTAVGLYAYEALVTRPDWPKGRFSYGDALTVADLCLLPQVYNARRWGLDIARWPRISQIEAECLATEPVKKSHPDVWKPAEKAG